MTAPLTDEQITQRARRRVDMKIGLYTHALIYVLVNLGLYAFNLYQGGLRWHAFPMLGWGLGLAIHGLVTWLDLRDDGLRERLLAAEIGRLRGPR